MRFFPRRPPAFTEGARLHHPPSLIPPVRELWVDLDGTLLGNKALPLSLDFVRAAISALRPHGGFRRAVRALWEVQRELGRPALELTPETANDRRVIGRFAARMGMGVEEARQFLREGLFVIFPPLRRHFFPIPGSRDFLDWAHGKIPLVLATNPVWPREIVELRLEWAGVDPKLFGFITHVREMHACKPSREYYEELLKIRGRRADECLLVGDDVRMDLPATRAGVRVFIARRTQELHELVYAGGQAPAWRGDFRHLRAMLEAHGIGAA